jgi:hypothetical protein
VGAVVMSGFDGGAVRRARASPARPGCAAQASAASGSPCTTKVCAGGGACGPARPSARRGRRGPRSPPAALTVARTGTISPWILTSGSPFTSRAPRLPPTWKPANTTWCRVGQQAFRWCSTRPPVAMPLAESTTAGQRAPPAAGLCAVATSRTPSASASASRGHAQQRGGARYSSVASMAIGLSRKIGRSAGISPARFRRCSTSSSACARPTAKVGSSTEPPRAMVLRMMSLQRARHVLHRVLAVAVGRSTSSTSAGARRFCGGGISRSCSRPTSPEKAPARAPARAGRAQADRAGAQQVAHGREAQHLATGRRPEVRPGGSWMQRLGEARLRIGAWCTAAAPSRGASSRSGWRGGRLLPAGGRCRAAAPRPARRWRAWHHRPAPAVLHQRRQPAAVVEVGVAQHHRVGFAQRAGIGPVALAVQLPALEQAAVEQDALAADLDQVARAGDGIGSAEEGDVHGWPSEALSPASSEGRAITSVSKARLRRSASISPFTRL